MLQSRHLSVQRCTHMHGVLPQVEMPDGLVVVGDAACSFNPVYGQGMTVAVQGADLLAETISARLQKSASLSPTAIRENLKGLSRVRYPSCGAV
jgi:2-polyprenyl-6-methoxyphenol hydroxylase-like FAD-dependent oxidoreductase